MSTSVSVSPNQTPANAELTYKVSIDDIGAHRFTVRCEIARPDPQGQVFSLPTWIAGSYLIRDFAKNITRLVAMDDNGAVALRQLDKTTWQVEQTDDKKLQGVLVLEYDIYAFDLSVRTAWLDTERGFFNGTSLFFRIHGQEHKPHYLQLVEPADQRISNWRVATAMPRVTGERYDYGWFMAANYSVFIDHPVELANFAVREFTVRGVEHLIVVSGAHRGDLDRLSQDVQQICKAHVDRFNDIPMPEYWFLLAVVGHGYGGLEHLDSTALLASRDDLPLPNMQRVGKKYRNLLGLFSHEYFHSWNVKRIQPAAYALANEQANTTSECYTQLLWAFEGITSYYDDYTLLTSGVLTIEDYLACLSENASRLYKFTGRHAQTLVDSSFNAWTKFYQQDENAPNAIVSYYGKGALAALGIDLLLRRETGKTLDDVMQLLWQRYGAVRVPVPESGVEAAVLEVAGEQNEVLFKDFFDCVLRTTQDYPFAELLADFGVQWRFSPKQKLPSLGLLAKHSEGRLLVTHTLAGGAAQQAGVAVGDELLALQTIRLRPSEWQQQVASYTVGTPLNLQVFRQDQLLNFPIMLQYAQPDSVQLTCMRKTETSSTALTRRQEWLGKS